ncbi:metallophosphoesterase [Bacteroidota bacterium]
MKKGFLLLVCIIISNILFAQISIYDIQYTNNSGDGSFPSDYEGQSVTTGGIVTAIDYLGGRYFISSSQGGAWNGVFIYDNYYSPSIGDSILITGTVFEYEGFTEIKDLTSFNVISTSNPLPETTKISTNQVTSEAYEGVFVEVNNCNVTSTFDSYGNWWVNDGSGACEIRPGIYNFMNDGFPLVYNYPFSSVIGVVGINYGSISIQPRTASDIQSADNAFVLKTDDKNVENNNNFSLPVDIAIHNRSETITSFSLKMEYNPLIFQYTGFEKTGTESESGSITDDSTEGNIILNYSGSFWLNELTTLIKLNFSPVASGNADLQFNTSTINGSNIMYYSEGELEYSSNECDIPIGDTLTVVQCPILNIPSIVVPGEELNITCFAPQTTTDWDAVLFYNNIEVPLDITAANYNSGLQKWTLTATIPDVDLYELYDLRISASDNITDEVTNAVKIIDQYKENYYFVQLTDTHLPTHYFYEDPEGVTDTSELNDLYEVIKDINLIQPEFVLLTGDLINEGELEDFECRRNHTRTVELLEKFEVPVYIVPGNHDLGGWDATPPSQGTARREWWRFFGWRQHEIPPANSEYLTHDYSFDYGNVHFTGLESYDNYDSYMYDIYGDLSFIPSQITWLQNDLLNAGSKTKVLFYHYDFKHELNLSSLGVDMALWGHIHSDAGDINSHPYDLSTDNVCDGTRAYRVIRVNGSNLQPENTIYTHSHGDMLNLNYHMINNGSLDSLAATIYNKQGQSFANGLIKFLMPLSDSGYIVTNGSLEQSYIVDSYAVCYVKVNIPANQDLTVTIKKSEGNTSINSVNNFHPKSLTQNYPNPFTDYTRINFELTQNANASLCVYNMSGKLIDILLNEKKHPGNYSIIWNGSDCNGNGVDSGIYIYKFEVNKKLVDTKQMIFIK